MWRWSGSIDNLCDVCKRARIEWRGGSPRGDETRRDECGGVRQQRTSSEPGRQKEAKMERRESGGGSSRAKENVDEKTFV